MNMIAVKGNAKPSYQGDEKRRACTWEPTSFWSLYFIVPATGWRRALGTDGFKALVADAQRGRRPVEKPSMSVRATARKKGLR